MVGMKDKLVYVRGKWIPFGREQIDQTYNLQEMKNGSKFKILVETPNYQKIVDLLIDGKGKWNATRKNPHESITKGALTKPAKVWFYFLCSIMLPSKHLCIVREKDAVLLYAILKGYKSSVGKIMENSIMSYYRGGYKWLIPHPALISRLYILGGVQEEWEEEENRPKTSPLTLTEITKKPKNINRGRRIEAVMEEEEPSKTYQPQPEGETPELPQRQRSLSPIMTFSPEVRQVQPEHVEGLEPLGNTFVVLEMLKAMRQEMDERDNHLKLQLQLGDEYMEAELKMRDQNLEEALKQRDEKWKSRWEIREQELRAREDAFLSYQPRKDSELLKIMKEMEDAMEKNLLEKADAFGYLYKEHQKEIRALIEKKWTKNWKAP